jgi:hypothetical protein
LLSARHEALTRPSPGRVIEGRPVILAVDGRSNNGKTTLAARIEFGIQASRSSPVPSSARA